MAELATVARPYAEAVYKVAYEQNQLDEWSDLLKNLVMVAQTPEFQQLPLDPKISSSQIVDLLMSLKTDVNSATVKRFLMQLVDHGRLQTLPEIIKQFHAMHDKKNNVCEAKIYTAYPLDEKQLNELMLILEKRFAMKLKPQVHVDESLIGGICAVVGDDTLDMSVKARLDQMKLALTA